MEKESMMAMATASLGTRDEMWGRKALPEFAATLAPVRLPEPQPLTDVTSGQTDPWVESVINRLNELRSLKEGWDGYRAHPMSDYVISNAYLFMTSVMSAATPAPSIVPLSSGHIQLAWHQNDLEIEVEILAPDHAIAFLHDRKKRVGDFDEEFRGDLGRLRKGVGLLNAR